MNGIERISRERERQQSEEGWTTEHDDAHTMGELALAACCYAAPVLLYRVRKFNNGWDIHDPWPWDQRYDKRNRSGNLILDPCGDTIEKRIDMLTKAGALIAAEIDRIQRIEKK